MSSLVQTVMAAQEKAAHIRPKVGGYPYLAEVMRQAGVRRFFFNVPASCGHFVFDDGAVVQQGTPLTQGLNAVPTFDEEALIRALRRDQAGESTFPEFVEASWTAGVVSYLADFTARTVTYFGELGESYVEEIPAVEV
jgi:uncharacterized protein YbcV (DUF1398 family)